MFEGLKNSLNMGKEGTRKAATRMLAVVTLFFAANAHGQENHNFQKGYEQNAKFIKEILQSPEYVEKHKKMIDEKKPYMEFTYDLNASSNIITSDIPERQIKPGVPTLDIAKIRDYNDGLSGNKKKGILISVDYTSPKNDSDYEQISLEVNDTDRDGKGDYFTVLGMVNNEWGPGGGIKVPKERNGPGNDPIPDHPALSRTEVMKTLGKKGQAVLNKLDKENETAIKLLHAFVVENKQ